MLSAVSSMFQFSFVNYFILIQFYIPKLNETTTLSSVLYFTRSLLSGAYAPKPQQLRGAPDNLHLGGEADFMTTSGEVYKGTFGKKADMFVPMTKPFMRKGPLMAETQNMSDYPMKRVERVKAVDPAQSTIDLKFNDG